MSTTQAGGNLCALHPRPLCGWCSGSGAEKFISQRFYTLYARGSSWGCVFSALFVGNTLSCSHTVAVCSIMVPHWANVQLGTLNSSFLLSPPMFSEAYGSQVLSWIYGYMCRKHNTHKTEIPQRCFQACWGYIKIKQMTSLPWIRQIRGSKLTPFYNHSDVRRY